MTNLNKDTFCIAPFTGLYLSTTGEIAPCCMSERVNTFGSATNKQGIINLYNSAEFKKLRADLINGVKNEICSKCWKTDKSGNNLRHHLNSQHMSIIPELLENIDDTYAIKNIKFYYMDIRFNNICNLKCRICNSISSSLWKSDEEKLGWYSPGVKIKVSVGNDIIDLIMDQLPHIREIYFAGGEPLIQNDHYIVLDQLLVLGRQDDVIIRYNTNFTTLIHGKYDVIDYWKKFSKVAVGASLDGNHKRAEYMRAGTNWESIVANRRRMVAETPSTLFYISATLSIMNAYNILDFHKEWVDSGLVMPNNFIVGILTHPDYYNICNLPPINKSEIIKMYEGHIAWLESYHTPEDQLLPMSATIGRFNTAISTLSTYDQMDGWANVWSRNNSLDRLRNEDFFEIFPEYIKLKLLLSC